MNTEVHTPETVVVTADPHKVAVVVQDPTDIDAEVDAPAVETPTLQ